MFSKEVQVTPELARVLLGKMKANRSLNRQRVDVYAEQMASGLWQRNPQGLVIDTNGNLIDGQHRLQAVLKCGKPILMTITYDAPTDAVKVMDIGQSRRIRQTLEIIGKDVSVRDSYVISCINAVRYIGGSHRTLLTDEYIAICERHRDTLGTMWRIGCFDHKNSYSIANALVFIAIENGESETDLQKFLTSFKRSEYVEGTNIKWAISLRDRIASGELKTPNAENFRAAEMYYRAFIRNLAKMRKPSESGQMLIPDLMQEVLNK